MVRGFEESVEVDGERVFCCGKGVKRRERERERERDKGRVGLGCQTTLKFVYQNIDANFNQLLSLCPLSWC